MGTGRMGLDLGHGPAVGFKGQQASYQEQGKRWLLLGTLMEGPGGRTVDK